MSCLYVRACNTKAEKQKIYMHGTASQDKADMRIYSHTVLCLEMEVVLFSKTANFIEKHLL